METPPKKRRRTKPKRTKKFRTPAVPGSKSLPVPSWRRSCRFWFGRVSNESIYVCVYGSSLVSSNVGAWHRVAHSHTKTHCRGMNSIVHTVVMCFVACLVVRYRLLCYPAFLFMIYIVVRNVAGGGWKTNRAECLSPNPKPSMV